MTAYAAEGKRGGIRDGPFTYAIGLFENIGESRHRECGLARWMAVKDSTPTYVASRSGSAGFARGSKSIQPHLGAETRP